ncbi:MAG TPA: ATP-grasp domain-containing protein, partial [Gaiellaceae bacterium]|nr:ATP-grasp domain-containing protein [Gaiellaceae bacterium]
MSVPSAYAARSRATAGTVPIPDPGPDPEGFVAALAEAAGRLRVAAVLPGTETSLTVLAGREADFPDSVVLGVPPRDVVERAIDKSLLAELAAGAGLKVPETRTVGRGGVDGVSFPAVVKPVTSSVRVGEIMQLGWVRRIDSAAELQAQLEAMPGDSLIVQPFLDGALSAACGVFWDGRLLCVEHQTAIRIWPPVIGVSSYAETVPRDPELEERIAALLTAIGWNGIFELQFIRRPEGDYVIDLNTRFYGSLALAVASGLNLPAIWADLLLGRTPQIGEYRVGVRYRSEQRDARAIAHRFRSGKRAEALGALLPRPNTVHGIFSARDPLPFLCRLTGFKAAPGALPPAG